MWIQQLGSAARLELAGNSGCEMWIKRHICELVGLHLPLIKLPPFTARNKVSETMMLLNYKRSLFICWGSCQPLCVNQIGWDCIPAHIIRGFQLEPWKYRPYATRLYICFHLSQDGDHLGVFLWISARAAAELWFGLHKSVKIPGLLLALFHRSEAL